MEFNVKPRNTLVLVRLKKKVEERQGQIYVPKDNNCFSEAAVLSCGPDTLSVGNGERATRDIRPGQRVLVQTHKPIFDRHGNMIGQGQPTGIEVKVAETREDDIWLFEQGYLLAILAEPEDIKETR